MVIRIMGWDVGMAVRHIYMFFAGVMVGLMLSLILVPSVWLVASYQTTVERQQLSAGNEKAVPTAFDTKLSGQLASIGLEPVTAMALSIIIIAAVLLASLIIRRVEERR